MFLLHLVSLTQSYRIPFFVLLVVCSIVGFLTSGTEESDQGTCKPFLHAQTTFAYNVRTYTHKLRFFIVSDIVVMLLLFISPTL